MERMSIMVEYIQKDNEVRNAFLIGALSAVSYLMCYFCKNILSVVSPHIVEATDITVEFIGMMSTSNMLSYAGGQLVNGIIGDKIKAKYLVSLGLILSGICSMFVPFTEAPVVMIVAYGLTGFFLSMLYAPLVKLIAENNRPIYATRCCLGLTFASFMGTPVAGVMAIVFQWKNVFRVCGILLIVIGIAYFVLIVLFEKLSIVKYNVSTQAEKKERGFKVLMKHGIVKFTVVSVLTGIVRTSVVFWIPTYLTQYLGFTVGMAATIFTVISVVQAISPYVNNLLLYEKLLKRNLNKMLLLAFTLSTVGFAVMFATQKPFINIVFLILALLTANGASTMIWSVYCPSLSSTGMVSSATGFLNFMSYIAAAFANMLFANAITQIGWKNLILVWTILMFTGVLISMQRKKEN